MKRRKDKSGMRYGRWTLIEEVQSGKSGRRWLCRCDCGVERVVNQNNLRRKASQSCGCLHKEYLSLTRGKDETGKNYGYLTVISRASKVSNGVVRWLCRCACGNTSIVIAQSLRAGNTKSCGCRNGKGHKYNAYHKLFVERRKNAHDRGYEWSLSEEESKDLFQRDCFYCGKNPTQSFKSSTNTPPILYNGIDRIDNTLGYTSDNVVSCCGQCNHAKSAHSQTEFRDWVKRVHNHWAGKSSG